MNTEQERDEFEWWASDEGEYPQAVERVGECYKLAQTQSYWMAWKARAALQSPAVQGGPVGWQFYQDGKWWHGDDRIKDHRKNTEESGFRVRDVYAAPQPVEQQPTTPEGWALVPVEPTEEMLAATSWPNCAGTDYRHMLAAAPKFGEEE